MGDADTVFLNAAATNLSMLAVNMQVLSWAGDPGDVEIFSLPAPTALRIL